jgi:hypothetical protein
MHIEQLATNSRRWQQFTGKTATLESSGKTFEQVKELRQ